MSDGDLFDDEPATRELTVELTDTLQAAIDEAWQDGGYTSRDEFVREALRDAVDEPHTAEDGWGQTVAHSPDETNRHSDEQKAKRQMRWFLLFIIVMIIIGYTLFTRTNPLLGVMAAAVVYWVFRSGDRRRAFRRR